MSAKPFRAGALLIAVVATANAQAVVRQAFDVATVKPNPSIERSSKSTIEPSGRVTVNNITMKHLIELAYGIGEYEVSGPDWLDTEKYDIVAQAYPGVAQEQVLQMGQVLIEERFHLKFHRETKQVPVYGLVVAKMGRNYRLATRTTASSLDSAAVMLTAGQCPWRRLPLGFRILYSNSVARFWILPGSRESTILCWIGPQTMCKRMLSPDLLFSPPCKSN